MNRTCTRLPAALLACTLGGCASGPTAPPPPVADPMNAANVTFYRDGSWVGLWGNIRVLLEGQELVLLGRNEHYSFSLDPGEYIVDYSIGLNECRGVIRVYPSQSYRYRLVPNCQLIEELR